jgi:hypothetical protein
MKNHHYLIVLLACCMLGLTTAACAPASATPSSQPTLPETQPSPTELLPSPTATELPTETALPPTATDTSQPATETPMTFPIQTPKLGTVVLDFVADACQAKWANGAVELPCPGNLDNTDEGYIAPTDQAVAEGGILMDAPTLIGKPGLGGEHGAGLFGTYPPLLIQPGDTFHAVIACQAGSPCKDEFALEYIDAQGNYQHDMNWSWMHAYGGGPVPITVDLSPLEGQTVQLVLVVRDQGWPETDTVLWVYPYVERLGP